MPALSMIIDGCVVRGVQRGAGDVLGVVQVDGPDNRARHLVLGDRADRQRCIGTRQRRRGRRGAEVGRRRESVLHGGVDGIDDLRHDDRAGWRGDARRRNLQRRRHGGVDLRLGDFEVLPATAGRQSPSGPRRRSSAARSRSRRSARGGWRCYGKSLRRWPGRRWWRRRWCCLRRRRRSARRPCCGTPDRC